MSPRVTAILIAHNGAEHLPRTLEALAAQTRRPDSVIMVDCASTDSTASLLAQFGPTHLVSSAEELSFGDAIAAAVRLTPPPSDGEELLWLLAQDTAPEPTALAALVNALEIAPSVVIAGPKQMDWDRADYIREFGETVTQTGSSVTLVAGELDQAQHDDLSDVMAVAAGGMLVRHTVWDALGGFDPGLPVVDDALDLCIRARLAGHRVSVVPVAKLACAGDGVAGASGSQKGRARRKRARQRRQAQLHRRLVYAPSVALPLHWLSLVPLAFVRAFMRLLQKQPGLIGAEFGAAFAAAFAGIRVSAARRQLKSTRTLSWASISTLRMPAAEVRRRRALQREQQRARVRGSRTELAFLSTGGAWTVLGAAALGLGMLAPLIGATAVVGGGLLPLDSPAGLWNNIGYGWRDIGTGFVGAADPFAAVLALLGSLTFWAPSAALLTLYFAALPLAALGAWLAAARFTGRGSLRAMAAVLWTIAPTFLSAIADGRVAPIIAHILLPWLIFAGAAAARSWSASAASALLFAAIVACAPSLAPALLVLWLLAVVFSGRSVMRFIAIPVPAFVLAAPLIFDQYQRSNLWGLIADPGVQLPSQAASTWQLVLGFPNGGLGGWDAIVSSLALPGVAADVVVPVLLAPLAVLALVGLFLPGSRVALCGVLAALLGFATAVAAAQISVATVGSESVPVWAGAGLSLYWAGLVAALLVALRAFSRWAVVPMLVTALAVALASFPLLSSIALGVNAPQPAAVHAGEQRILPAFVTAEAQSNPRAGTLVLQPQPNGAVFAQLQRGAGTLLDDQSTLFATQTELSDSDQELAELAGNLSSRSGYDPSESLHELGIRFVLLSPAVAAPGETVTAEANDAARRAASSLDGNAELVPVGETDFGTLWRYQAEEGAAVGGEIPADAGGWFATTVMWVQIAVFAFVVLLSIPTGVGRDGPNPQRNPLAPVQQAETVTPREPKRGREPKPPREPRSNRADSRGEARARRSTRRDRSVEPGATEASEPAEHSPTETPGASDSELGAQPSNVEAENLSPEVAQDVRTATGEQPVTGESVASEQSQTGESASEEKGQNNER